MIRSASRHAPPLSGSRGRLTHSTVQYRVLRLCRRAGVSTYPGALVYGLRHTFATDLANANANASVYELKNLLGHESLATSQRYVISAWPRNSGGGTEPALQGDNSRRLTDSHSLAGERVNVGTQIRTRSGNEEDRAPELLAQAFAMVEVTASRHPC